MAEIMSVAKQISAVLIDELREAAQHTEFGVVVRDVKPLNYEDLIEIAGPVSGRSNAIRLALVDKTETVEAVLNSSSEKAGFVSWQEETAVQWRNKQRAMREFG